MKNREELRQNDHNRIKKRHVMRGGENINFRRGGKEISFSDRNIDPCQEQRGGK
jgi:hypothetical protein